MIVNISSKHIEIGEHLKTFINKEINTVSDLLENILEANIVISKNNHHFNADISVHISRNFTAHCHGENIDAYKSVSEAIEKLKLRIKKFKNRLRDLKRNKTEKDYIPAQHYILQASEEDISEANPIIIAEMNSEITTLSVSEAVTKMDVSDVPVVVFRNARNGEINVVYRRKDNNIGWIDPNR